LKRTTRSSTLGEGANTAAVTRSEGGMRRGYMGHLTRIANTVVHNLEKGPVHTQINYQIQQMTANFVDQFGFNDDEFTDHDDSIGCSLKASEVSEAKDKGWAKFTDFQPFCW
ncbi:hypothetical protein XENOCAPTIV_008623, partial [Xenoophorus captivus]